MKKSNNNERSHNLKKSNTLFVTFNPDFIKFAINGNFATSQFHRGDRYFL